MEAAVKTTCASTVATLSLGAGHVTCPLIVASGRLLSCLCSLMAHVRSLCSPMTIALSRCSLMAQPGQPPEGMLLIPLAALPDEMALSQAAPLMLLTCPSQ